jgi:hypothetical protein
MFCRMHLPAVFACSTSAALVTAQQLQQHATCNGWQQLLLVLLLRLQLGGL